MDNAETADWRWLEQQHPVLALPVLAPMELAEARLACLEVQPDEANVVWYLFAHAARISEDGMGAEGPIPSPDQLAWDLDMAPAVALDVLNWLLGTDALEMWGPTEDFPRGKYAIRLKPLPHFCLDPGFPPEQITGRTLPVTYEPAPEPAPWYRRMSFEVINRRRSLLMGGMS